MFKRIIVILALAFSFSAKAEQISFSCNYTESPDTHLCFITGKPPEEDVTFLHNDPEYTYYTGVEFDLAIEDGNFVNQFPILIHQSKLQLANGEEISIPTKLPIEDALDELDEMETGLGEIFKNPKKWIKDEPLILLAHNEHDGKPGQL